MNANQLLMMNRLSLAGLRHDLEQFDHSELVEIQSDLIETLRVCLNEINKELEHRVVVFEPNGIADQG